MLYFRRNGPDPAELPEHPDPTEPHGSAGVLAVFDSVVVTPETVATPLGEMPLRGAEWTVADLTTTRHGITVGGVAWMTVFSFLSIVLAITATDAWWFLTGMVAALGVLMRNSRATDHIAVSVASDGRYFQATVPALSVYTVLHVRQRVTALAWRSAE